MNIENINNQRILTPKENMWLCNKNAQVISDKVYLGKTADATDWIEITDAEKEVIEKEDNYNEQN
jgi:hypothetical protein